jgi:hypothetical protein
MLTKACRHFATPCLALACAYGLAEGWTLKIIDNPQNQPVLVSSSKCVHDPRIGWEERRTMEVGKPLVIEPDRVYRFEFQEYLDEERPSNLVTFAFCDWDGETVLTRFQYSTHFQRPYRYGLQALPGDRELEGMDEWYSATRGSDTTIIWGPPQIVRDAVMPMASGAGSGSGAPAATERKERVPGAAAPGAPVEGSSSAA